MNSKLLHQYKKLETSKEVVLSGLRKWPEERLGQHPASGGWSALEVIEHVTLTEHSIVATMRRNLQVARRIRIIDWLRNARVLSVMLLPIQVRIPAVARLVVPEGKTATLAEAEDQWNAARRDLSEFLEAARESDLSGGVVRHPAGGWTNIKGALWFLRSHLRHHRYQLSRIEAALR